MRCHAPVVFCLIDACVPVSLVLLMTIGKRLSWWYDLSQTKQSRSKCLRWAEGTTQPPETERTHELKWPTDERDYLIWLIDGWGECRYLHVKNEMPCLNKTYVNPAEHTGLGVSQGNIPYRSDFLLRVSTAFSSSTNKMTRLIILWSVSGECDLLLGMWSNNYPSAGDCHQLKDLKEHCRQQLKLKC